MDPFESLPTELKELLRYMRRERGLRYLQPFFHERRARGPAWPTRLDDDATAVLDSVIGEEYERLAGTLLAKFRADAVDASLLRRLRSHPAIDYAERMPTRWLRVAAADPTSNLQWGLRAIRWFDAPIRTSRPVRIGVIDSGIDRSHPDLAPALSSYTYVYERKRLMATDRSGHGTHVAGILAARNNPARGVSGVAADAKLDVWKIFSDRRSGGHFPVLTSLYGPAFRQALDSGIRALNLSIGGLEPLKAEQDAIASLTSQGVTVVAAMGNEGSFRTEYPAGYDIPGLVAVGAVNERLERCAFSNCGHHIDLVAPGSNILSTFPHRRTKHGPKDAERSYSVMDGTSMATPLVTATAALLSAAFPALNPEQVEAHLCRTSKRVPAMSRRKRTDEYGWGLLNVAQALESST